LSLLLEDEEEQLLVEDEDEQSLLEDEEEQSVLEDEDEELESLQSSRLLTTSHEVLIITAHHMNKLFRTLIYQNYNLEI
jgi:hypothetical protein